MTRIEVESFGLPAQDTVLRGVLDSIIDIAVGELNSERVRSGLPVLRTGMEAIHACTILRVKHQQLILVMQNLLKATEDEKVGIEEGGGEGRDVGVNDYFYRAEMTDKMIITVRGIKW